MKNLDWYQICLLAWYFGICPNEVIEQEWSQEDIDKAQAYFEKQHIDPIEYWE